MKDSIWAVPFFAQESEDLIKSVRKDHVKRVDPLIRQAFVDSPGHTWEQKLTNCANCVCCVVHQIRKPLYLNPWIETTFRNKYEYNEKMCKCNCRHMARFICRQIEIDEHGNNWLPPCPN